MYATREARRSSWITISSGLGGLLLLLTLSQPRVVLAAADGGPVRHVIHISVDGLRPDAVTRHDADELPAFYRLRRD